MFEEGDEPGRDTDQLHGRNVHIDDVFGRDKREIPAVPGEHQRLRDFSIFINRRVGLGDFIVVFLVGREILDFAGQPAVVDLLVRRFDEAECIDSREC